MLGKEQSKVKEGQIAKRTSPEIDKFLDGSILRQPSSVELGWKNFAVERRTILPSELPELVLDNHFLILWQEHVAQGETAYRTGKFSAYQKYPDTMTACHPGIRPAVRNKTSHEVIVASLQPAFVGSIEEELDHRPTGSLQNLHTIDDSDLRNLLMLLTRESQSGGEFGTLYADSLQTALATRLVYATRLLKMPVKAAASGLPKRILLRIMDLMRVGLSTDLNLATLAAESGYSRVHFLRAFKAAMGQTPHRYLNELRLQKARDLLIGRSPNLIDVAAACGFSSHGHLTTAFRARFGLPPSQFRREQGKSHSLVSNQFRDPIPQE